MTFISLPHNVPQNPKNWSSIGRDPHSRADLINKNMDRAGYSFTNLKQSSTALGTSTVCFAFENLTPISACSASLRLFIVCTGAPATSARASVAVFAWLASDVAAGADLVCLRLDRSRQDWGPQWSKQHQSCNWSGQQLHLSCQMLVDSSKRLWVWSMDWNWPRRGGWILVRSVLR